MLPREVKAVNIKPYFLAALSRAFYGTSRRVNPVPGRREFLQSSNIHCCVN
jgi:hypothetical protein